MKIIRKIALFVLTLLLVIPLSVKAEEKEPVKIYMFRGATCHYCEDAIAWFNSIEGTYGKYFDLVKYEVWNSQVNSEFMQTVAKFMGDQASGVPYIIIGDYTYSNGFGADSVIDQNGTTMGQQLLSQVMKLYEQDNRFDVMNELRAQGISIPEPDKEIIPKDTTAVTIVVCIVVAGGLAGLVYARKRSN